MHDKDGAVVRKAEIPKWYWVVSGLALIWNLIGLAAFVAQLTTNPGSLPAAEQAFRESTPVWATLAFGVAVIAGVAGSVLLLLRRRVAVPAFIASFLGIAIQNTHSILISNGIEVYGAAGLVLPLLTLIIAAGLVVFARKYAMNATTTH